MDRQLDARIAREVFGLTVEDRRLWQAPDTGAWALCPWCNASPPGHCPSLDLAVPPERHSVGPAQLTPAGWRAVPFYSARIEDAWAVVDSMSARGWAILLEDWRLAQGAPGQWAVYYTLPDGHSSEQVCGDTAPLAICLATLRAMRPK